MYHFEDTNRIIETNNRKSKLIDNNNGNEGLSRTAKKNMEVYKNQRKASREVIKMFKEIEEGFSELNAKEKLI